MSPARRRLVAAACAAVDVPQPADPAPGRDRAGLPVAWWPGSSRVRARRTPSPPPATWSRRACSPRSTTSARTPSTCTRPTATRDAYLTLLELLADDGLTDRRRGVGQALRGRPGAARRRREGRAGERPRDLRGGPRRRHHGHPRHGGPHHHRLDAGHPARAARGLPRDRCGAAGLPAPHRGRLPRPRLRRVAGAAVQGRLQGAGVGGVPGQASRSTSPTSAASRC